MRKQILDHGYLELIETWGSDERIIEAARMSTGKGFKGWGPRSGCSKCGSPEAKWDREMSDHPGVGNCPKCGSCFIVDNIPGDEKLLKFLWDNKHHTPFEMAGMTVETQSPIFVFREWHRHRVPFGYNEASARYEPLPDFNYVPTKERLLVGGDGKNKQAGTVKDSSVLDEEGAEEFRTELSSMYAAQEAFYQKWLARGVPKELARIDLPVGRYSKMRATANLRGWLAFLSLRLPKTAQQEIRVYAEAVGELIAEKFPRTWGLFIEGK